MGDCIVYSWNAAKRLCGACLCIFALWFASLEAAPPTWFVIVSPSYNNAKWCVRSLNSVRRQNYPHWSLVYVNDASTDDTRVRVERFIEKYQLKDKIQLINNEQRSGAMANFYNVISSLDPKVVVVTLDGDDRLAHGGVLELLAQVYADPNVWMTYGNYRTEPGHVPSLCAPFPDEVLRKRSFRKHPWVSSHLRTYRAKLFQKVKRADFMWHGFFVPSACDVAIMMPLLELASLGHIRYIPEVLYLYNVGNPIRDVTVNGRLQINITKYIRSRKPYKPLKTLY